MNEMKKYDESKEFKFWYLANKQEGPSLNEKFIN